MKLKYKNITIPYQYYDKKYNRFYYIYKDRIYTDYNKLFQDFLGFYLTYHFNIKDKEYEVHNLSEVLEYLVKYKEDFKIPKKYKEEYSQEEYKYIDKLKKVLVENSLRIEYDPERELIYSKKDYGTRKIFDFSKEVYIKYKNTKVPKKIYSEELNSDCFVVSGNYYYSIYRALDQVFDYSFYYQFGGTKSQNNRSHFHSHNFEELIDLIFKTSTKFKIHTSQREFYSDQELEFLTKLSDKFKKMKFKSIERVHDNIEWQEYNYLKDNKKYLSLLIHNIKFYNEDKKFEKERLQSHKI